MVWAEIGERMEIEEKKIVYPLITLVYILFGLGIIAAIITLGEGVSQNRLDASSAAARCRSLNGEFDGMTGKCFMLGEEV